MLWLNLYNPLIAKIRYGLEFAIQCMLMMALNLSIRIAPASFNTKLRFSGFLNRESDNAITEDDEEIRASLLNERQPGSHSVRSCFSTNMKEGDLNKHDVHAMVENDQIPAAAASEKFKWQDFIAEKTVSSLYLFLCRVACITNGLNKDSVTRTQGIETILKPAHVEKISTHVFFYTTLVDYSCAEAEDRQNSDSLGKASFWTHIQGLNRSIAAAARDIQFALSEAKFTSRLVKSNVGIYLASSLDTVRPVRIRTSSCI
jgi:hypothetical protein